MKKLLTALLTIAMLLSIACLPAYAAGNAWDGTVATAFASGTGTENDPYIISNASQLAYLAQSVNGGETYAGKYIEINADIDLGNQAWTPIGNSGNSFRGILDGNGKAISNLKVEGASFLGLFGHTRSGKISNLGVASGTVVSNTGDGVESIGGFVGRADWTQFENCYNCANVTVTAPSLAVGFAGFLGRAYYAPNENPDQLYELIYCANFGDVTVGSEAQPYTAKVQRVGGLIGADTTGTNDKAGFVQKCLNVGDVNIYSADVQKCAAMAGMTNSDFMECLNFGTITLHGATTVSENGSFLGYQSKSGYGNLSVTSGELPFVGNLASNGALEGTENFEGEPVIPTVEQFVAETVSYWYTPPADEGNDDGADEGADNGADNGDGNESDTEADTTDTEAATTAEDTEAAEEGGCGSTVVGSIAVVAVAAMGAGITVAKKKKD